jgi:hypothetical protein
MDLGGEQRPNRRVTANNGLTDLLRSHMGDDHMLALGSCIAGAGILIAGLSALLFQHPNLPRWARPEIVPMLICLPITGMISIGLAFTAAGWWQLVNGTGDLLGVLTFAAVVIGLELAWRALGIRQRLREYTAASDGISSGAFLASEPSLGTEEPPPRPSPGAGSGRRAA